MFILEKLIQKCIDQQRNMEPKLIQVRSNSNIMFHEQLASTYVPTDLTQKDNLIDLYEGKPELVKVKSVAAESQDSMKSFGCQIDANANSDLSSREDGTED